MLKYVIKLKYVVKLKYVINTSWRKRTERWWTPPRRAVVRQQLPDHTMHNRDVIYCTPQSNIYYTPQCNILYTADTIVRSIYTTIQNIIHPFKHVCYERGTPVYQMEGTHLLKEEDGEVVDGRAVVRHQLPDHGIHLARWVFSIQGVFGWRPGPFTYLTKN